jgi:hypothetical protein
MHHTRRPCTGHARSNAEAAARHRRRCPLRLLLRKPLDQGRLAQPLPDLGVARSFAPPIQLQHHKLALRHQVSLMQVSLMEASCRRATCPRPLALALAFTQTPTSRPQPPTRVMPRPTSRKCCDRATHTHTYTHGEDKSCSRVKAEHQPRLQAQIACQALLCCEHRRFLRQPPTVLGSASAAALDLLVCDADHGRHQRQATSRIDWPCNTAQRHRDTSPGPPILHSRHGSRGASPHLPQLVFAKARCP